MMQPSLNLKAIRDIWYIVKHIICQKTAKILKQLKCYISKNVKTLKAYRVLLKEELHQSGKHEPVPFLFLKSGICII